MSAFATERRVPRAVKTYPVVELFGPTIQGEGPDAGTRAFFVRIGGCDYRCSWCDSMHAVEPELVRQAPRRSARWIAEELAQLGAHAGDLIVLSGGNPALHKLGGLVERLHALELRVSVETQGSIWREWLGNVDRLVVSPKPPSSGMADELNRRKLDTFLASAHAVRQPVAMKVVIFHRTDYEWTRRLLASLPRRPAWVGLSCGTNATGRESLAHTAARFRWLCETVAADVDAVMDGVVCLPQLHVIAWGHALGR